MSFQVGDLVECVDASPGAHCLKCFQNHGKLRLGAIYRVSALSKSGTPQFSGFRAAHEPGRGWRENRFRKITAADEQFTASIRKRKTAPA